MSRRIGVLCSRGGKQVGNVATELRKGNRDVIGSSRNDTVSMLYPSGRPWCVRRSVGGQYIASAFFLFFLFKCGIQKPVCHFLQRQAKLRLCLCWYGDTQLWCLAWVAAPYRPGGAHATSGSFVFRPVSFAYLRSWCPPAPIKTVYGGWKIIRMLNISTQSAIDTAKPRVCLSALFFQNIFL